MKTQADKTALNKSKAVANTSADKKNKKESEVQFEDNRVEVVAQRKLEGMADNSSHTGKIAQLQTIANGLSSVPVQKQEEEEELLQGKFETIQKQRLEEEEIQAKSAIVQKKEESPTNYTGLPDTLKSGIENLSGLSLDDVKVHYNSAKPAQLHAHAYAQGADIHMAPGQEKHLPHEAWHVVQQKQGRVRPTKQLKGKVNVNDDAGLEKEADVMGERAVMGGSINKISCPGATKKTSAIIKKDQIQLKKIEVHLDLRGAAAITGAGLANVFDTEKKGAIQSFIENLGSTKPSKDKSVKTVTFDTKKLNAADMDRLLGILADHDSGAYDKTIEYLSSLNPVGHKSDALANTWGLASMHGIEDTDKAKELGKENMKLVQDKLKNIGAYLKDEVQPNLEEVNGYLDEPVSWAGSAVDELGEASQWLSDQVGVLSKIPTVQNIVPIIGDVIRIAKSLKAMVGNARYYNELMKEYEEVSPLDKSKEMKPSGGGGDLSVVEYQRAKMNRGMKYHLQNLIHGSSNIIATVASGGLALPIIIPINLGKGLIDSGSKIMKYLIKYKKGTAGANRVKAAEKVVQEAIDGDIKSQKLVHYACGVMEWASGKDFASYLKMLKAGKRWEGQAYSDEQWNKMYNPKDGTVTVGWVEAVRKVTKAESPLMRS